DELDKLAGDKVSRAVIRWTDQAPQFDQELKNWLQTSAQQAGRQQQVDARFAPVPVTIRELHLAAVPSDQDADADPFYAPAGSEQRIHKRDVDAVLAALRTAYETLPRDELLAAIQSGNRLERAAALAGGGGRLDADKLPVLLKLADDN